jgi:dihydrofolate reductase/thymidylate synthase
MSYFKAVTANTSSDGKVNAVVMGRRTWEGIPAKHRPLSGRVNIVVTTNREWAAANLPSGVLRADSLQNSLDLASAGDLSGRIERLVVIGGAQLFEDCALHAACDAYHVTYLDQDFECDAFLTPATIRALDSAPVTHEHAPVLENGVEMRWVVNGVLTAL